MITIGGNKKTTKKEVSKPSIKSEEIVETKPTIVAETKEVKMKTEVKASAPKSSTKTLLDDDPLARLISTQFGQSDWDNKTITSKTGFDLMDAALSSNVEEPEGLVLRTLNGFLGMSGIGKTTLTLQISGNIVNNGGDGSRLIVFDAEKASVKERILMLGVDPKKLIDPIKRGTTVEAFYGLLKVLRDLRAKQREEQGEDWIMANPYVVLADSIASMPSEREVAADEDINKAMGTVARLHSGLMKLYLDAMFEFNITVIFINQLRDKLTIGGAPAPKQLAYERASETYSGGKA